MTGYTGTMVEKNQTFPQFAMSCARAFGALIMMRDDPINAPIPERFEPSDYDAKKLAEAEDALARYSAMSAGELLQVGQRLKAEDEAMWKESADKAEGRLGKLNAMLAKVEAWTPPSPDHDGLKRFMREQLVESIKWEGSTSQEMYQKALAKPAKEYADEAVERARRDIAYHRKGHIEEVGRVEGRNDWLAKLRASLAGL